MNEPVQLRPGDPGFPDQLAHDTHPLERVWVLGAPLAAHGPMVAVVGTRTPTEYGLDVARDLAGDLAAQGICVVSGMARGIDAAAHEGALRVGGGTVAVLGGGVDVPHPRHLRALYDAILSGGGTIVSQFPLGSKPYRGNFPVRNRVIAALSLGVVVVQAAAHRSGALGTAQHADALGREVFAVPGDIRSPVSEGVHDLFRSGAHICTRADDVLGVLDQPIRRALRIDPDGIPLDAGDDVRAVLKLLVDGPQPLERIARQSGLELVTAMRTLSRLEQRGLVVRFGAAAYRARWSNRAASSRAGA